MIILAGFPFYTHIIRPARGIIRSDTYQLYDLIAITSHKLRPRYIHWITINTRLTFKIAL